MERLEKYKNLRLHFSSSDGNGCGTIRSKWPSEFMKQYFVNTKFTCGFPPKDPENQFQDVFFLQRISHEYFYTEFFPYCKKTNKKVICDMDDNLWEIPASNLAHNHYPPKELKKVSKNIESADAIITSTIPLANYIKQRFNPNVFVIPNMLNRFWDYREIKNDIPVIGWGGSYTHVGDFDNKLVCYLKEIVKAKKAKFELFGYHPKYFLNIANSLHKWVECDDHLEVLKGYNWDIGLAVTSKNIFNECKSNQKFLEYSAVSTVTVADNSFPYINSIEHGNSGFIVKNHKTDWREYIDFLISNPDKRNEMAKAANEYVKNNFTYQYNGDIILNRYLDVLDFVYSK